MRNPRYSTRAQRSQIKVEEQHLPSTRPQDVKEITLQTRSLRKHQTEPECASEESKHKTPRMRTRRSRLNDSPEETTPVQLNGHDEETSPRISTRSSCRQEEISYRRETRAQHRQCEVAQMEGEEESHDADSMDMYTRVKRVRRQPKRDMYGFIIDNGEQGEKTTEDEESEENEEQENNEETEVTEESEEESQRQYNLRQNKPKTQFFSQVSEVVKKRERVHRDINPYFENQTPPQRRSSRARFKNQNGLGYRSPAHRRHKSRRKRRAAHDCSSSSTSTSGSDDEKSFARRKKKSMAKARMRCLPMNLRQEDLATINNDRQKIGASLADIDPMSLDRSITFDSVGGLTNHVRSLKEMVVFPLLYPEVFDKFSITPPRGVLFYGPPGTGKTLVARALANECSIGEKRVAFFMRKGADCLSKWVGESERQLRLLFDQAYQMRPSIIFFDEIDGLAPVRSSRQDQIHSSIVSTLLALMDGLDSRGEVVVIGATNRIDSIDPALRRPGRFDREFLFTLPNVSARTDILRIHTKQWKPPLLDEFLQELAQKSFGYCGADLKSLCTEAALQALRRQYPQIYNSSDKLQLDLNNIQVTALDFHHALKSVSPASRRSVLSVCCPLSSTITPLLSKQLHTVCKIIEKLFPHNKPHQQTDQLVHSDSKGAHSIHQAVRNLNNDEITPKSFFNFSSNIFENPPTYKPRLLISGTAGQAHDTHLTPAVLHNLEYLPQHTIDLITLYHNSSVSADEACTQVFREARRCSPSVLYVPNIDIWWDSLHSTVQHNMIISINELYLHSNVLLIVSVSEYQSLPQRICEMFSGRDQIYTISNPTTEQTREYFSDLILNQAKQPPPTHKEHRPLEVLQKAPLPAPSQLTEQEEKALWEGEEAVLRELRLFLRGILNNLASDRKFTVFTKPVDMEDVPDYYEIIKKPMDLSTMMSNIDLHEYQTCKQFLSDIDLICHNALEYNPPTSSAGRAIRHRACALKDTAYAMTNNELDEDFEKQCESIVESRQRRGKTPTKSAPRYYHVKPDSSKCGRYSKRLRGQTADIIIEPSRHENASRCHNISHHEQPDDIQNYRDEEITFSTVKRKKRKRNAWSAGIIKKPKIARSSPSKADKIQPSGTEDEEEKPDSHGDKVRRTVADNSTRNEANNEEGEPELKEHGFQVLSDPEMENSDLNESSKIEEDDDIKPENPKPNLNGEQEAEQVALMNADQLPTKELTEIIPANSAQLTNFTEEKQVIVNEDTSSKSGESSASKVVTPTKSGDTTTESVDVESGESPHKQHEKILLLDRNGELDLEINTAVLQNLLKLIVTVTAGYNVNQLEEVYSNITSLIFQHRYSDNKHQLTQEIEELIYSYRVDDQNGY